MTVEHKTRVAFIGAGGIAARHVGTLGQMTDVEIVGFADPDFDRASMMAAGVGARAYLGHSELIEAERPDALYICVPPFAHGEPEMAAIEAGLPFFVEKPLSLDVGGADVVAQEVGRSGLITAVGYHWRYLDTVEEAHALLRDKPAQLVTGFWLDQDTSTPMVVAENKSGGQVIEQATHLVDLARYLVGDISEVFAQVSHAPPRPDFPDLDVATSTAVSLRFAGGAVGTLSTACMLRWGHRVGLHLFGDGLAIELSDHDIMVDVGQGRPVRHAGRDPVHAEDRDFIDAVRGLPNRIRSPYAEALKSHRVALAIAESARIGQPVRIREQADV